MKNDFKKNLIWGGVDHSFTGSVRGLVSQVILNVIPDLIGYLSRVNKTVIIGRVRRTDNLSLIKKEAAGILGSCVASPRMTVEKGYCHLEPRAIARGCKDLINKCRDCIELTRLKQVRIKLKRDLYGDFACAQPLKMTMIICFALCLGVVGEAKAATTCESGKKVCGTGCIDEALTCNSCGGSCYYTQTSSGAVTLYGSGEAMSFSGYRLKEIDGIKGYYSGDTADTKHPFCNNADITSVTFDTSSNFTSIGNMAFFGMTGVTGELKIPDSVTSIGASAFELMTHVTSLTIPDSVTSIGGYAFKDMDRVTSITIPDSVTNMGNDVFQTMARLKSLMIPDSVNTEKWSRTFGYFTSPADFICLGEMDTCYAKLAKFFTVATCPEGVTCTCSSGCINSSRVKPATQAQCTGSYGWNGVGCSRKNEDGSINCAGGYAKLKGNCVDPLKTFAKKRYTPAEAAQWLNEDNNTVTLTFKK